MSDETFKATAYVKDGCPFSFKFLTFAAEAGLLDQIKIVRVREGDPSADATKQRLSEKLGKPVSFPTVEVEPDRYLSDSDRIIEHIARRHGVQADDLPVLSFYKQTIFPKLIEHYKLTSGGKAADKA
jgi:glutathione S-transferase